MVAVGAALFGCTQAIPNPSAPSPTTTPAQDSDAAIQAAMVENINKLPDSTVAIPRDANGVPDIAVRDKVLIVATTEPASAASLCRTVAAMTKAPDTAAPLGVLSVVVMSGGQRIADCLRY
jgi:hypothetical protein